MTCTENVSSEEYADFITHYYTAPEEFLRSQEGGCADIVSHQYAVVYSPLPPFGKLTFSSYTYAAIPKLYALLDTVSLEEAGIAPALRLPALSGGGSGVLIGFIDTGIDYQNPLFRNRDGTTRIVGIWDQTLGAGNDVPENGFRSLYGTVFSREQINEALDSPDPLSVVPSADVNGHGTFLASVAAGGEDPANGFSGAAPQASIAVVRLKGAKRYLRDFYLIPEEADAYQENDIMMGVTYLYTLARRFSMPLVICLGLGSSQGSHLGRSPLDLFLDQVSSYTGTVVVVAAGNETGYGTHYTGTLVPNSGWHDVELRVGEGDPGFTMEFWGQAIEIYRIGFVSPTGEVVKPLPTSTGDETAITFLLEQTEVNVYYDITVASTGNQLIFMRFRNPQSGIWHIVVSGTFDIGGMFYLWLPVHEFLSPGNTYFLRPDPDMTITTPGNSRYPLTVTACDPENGGIYLHASRGYARSGQVKPEIAAPGVNVLGAALSPALYTRKSGTSVAAAYAAGAAAILMKWGIVDGNDPYMNTSVIRTCLIRGAKRNPALLYPNREFGYGTLDLYSAFLTLRG